ncbi:hypothetical protein [Halioglobus sp. HI00S01]|nr:hypothetical protein [Halioglobus sp. HI00S01]
MNHDPINTLEQQVLASASRCTSCDSSHKPPQPLDDGNDNLLD